MATLLQVWAAVKYAQVLCLLIFMSLPAVLRGNAASKRLYDDLMHKQGYNKLVRPVNATETPVRVKIGLRLSQLIDLDERNQFIRTNLWVLQEWQDPALTWDPEEYSNVTEINVPVEMIWHPDIVLLNNADGVYMLTMKTKAQIQWTGTVKWKPPASMRSSCMIDVLYFPFDEQRCTMMFGSWTYDIHEVKIDFLNDTEDSDLEIEHGVDLREFYRSVEWDILAAPAKRSTFHLAGSLEPFQRWTFVLYLRRKFLFYTVNLITPLVSHAFITLLVFYLPSESREKVSLCINILLSMTVYFLLLAEIIPPTSKVVPLLAKYLTFTMVLVTISIIITAITLNVHFRSASTHNMPDWVKKVFLYFLPRLLRMKRPKIENSHDVYLKHIRLNLCSCLSCDSNTQDHHDNSLRYQFGSKRTKTQAELIKLSKEIDNDIIFRQSLHKKYSHDVAEAIEGAVYIANHLKSEDEEHRTQEDWKYVALVIDRIFLIIYILVCVFGTVGIIAVAPTLYDNRKPIVH